MKIKYFMKDKIYILGDIILDKFTYCDIEKINPEAPCQLIKIKYSNYKLGGSSNVANNLDSLGLNIEMFGIIGNDNAGKKIKELSSEISNYFIQDYSKPTILKERFISENYNQQILRADYEQKYTLNEKQLTEILLKFKEITPKYTIISDYNKGFISKKLINEIKKTNTKILVDPKPENIDFYYNVFLIKPNLKEASEIYGRKIINEDKNIEKAGLELVKKYKSNFIITRGEKGSTLITKDKKIKHVCQEPIDIFDVTGAGDTYISALTYGLIKYEDNLEKAIEIAQIASKLVVQKSGTATITKSEIDKYI